MQNLKVYFQNIVAFISTVVANGVGSPPVYDSLKRRILVNKNASSKIE